MSITGIEGDVAAIAADIAAKDANVPYRPADEYWLLIYASGDMLASTMMPSPLATVQAYTTAFDRVYVLDTAGQVWPLTTHRLLRPLEASQLELLRGRGQQLHRLDHVLSPPGQCGV